MLGARARTHSCTTARRRQLLRAAAAGRGRATAHCQVPACCDSIALVLIGLRTRGASERALRTAECTASTGALGVEESLSLNSRQPTCRDVCARCCRDSQDRKHTELQRLGNLCLSRLRRYRELYKTLKGDQGLWGSTTMLAGCRLLLRRRRRRFHRRFHGAAPQRLERTHLLPSPAHSLSLTLLQARAHSTHDLVSGDQCVCDQPSCVLITVIWQLLLSHAALMLLAVRSLCRAHARAWRRRQRLRPHRRADRLEHHLALRLVFLDRRAHLRSDDRAQQRHALLRGLGRGLGGPGPQSNRQTCIESGGRRAGRQAGGQAWLPVGPIQNWPRPLGHRRLRTCIRIASCAAFLSPMPRCRRGGRVAWRGGWCG